MSEEQTVEKMADHSPLPWRWHWRFEEGLATGSIYSEQRTGHAYAVAMTPRYQTQERWEADAALIVAAVNSHAALVAERDSLKHDIERHMAINSDLLAQNEKMREALDREEAVLQERVDSYFCITHGDIEVAFHRIRAALSSAKEGE